MNGLLKRYMQTKQEPYFVRPERISQLQAAAKSWEGTPWVYGSAAKGHGVDCVRLCVEIYRECGALPPRFTVPVRGFGSKQAETAERCLRGSVHFAQRTAQPEVGDLMIIVTDRMHFAVVIRADAFIHCMAHCGVAMAGFHDVELSGSIRSVWTPMENL